MYVRNPVVHVRGHAAASNPRKTAYHREVSSPQKLPTAPVFSNDLHWHALGGVLGSTINTLRKIAWFGTIDKAARRLNHSRTIDWTLWGPMFERTNGC